MIWRTKREGKTFVSMDSLRGLKAEDGVFGAWFPKTLNTETRLGQLKIEGANPAPAQDSPLLPVLVRLNNY